MQLLSFLIILFGITLRFYHQFIEWSFNGDEVDLGFEILNHSFQDLFYPFQNRQSAPPLFLLVEKLISEIGKPYISLKIITFLSSCASLFLFRKILKRYFPFYLQIILLALFCFNPFVIGNSLTLKQYSFDLMLGLIAVNCFTGSRSPYNIFLFFSIFCLLSNVGLFFCAAFSIFLFLKIVYENKDFFFWKGITRIAPFLFAPIPYLLFFLWFMKQPGAEKMKNYMIGYWSGAFMPLDISILRWSAIQAKVITLFFFSTYWIVGVPILFLFLLGLYFFFKNRKNILKNRLLVIISLYIITTLVHLALSAMRMYPFSDRLFLYLAPGIYLILGFGILELNKRTTKGSYSKTILLVLSCTIVFYFTYLPRKKNDVAALMKFINSTDKTVAFTPKAKTLSLKWLAFTGFDNLNTVKLRKAGQLNLNNSKADLFIAVQSIKFGHTKKLSTPEPVVEKLLQRDKICFNYRVGGYVIYKSKIESSVIGTE